MKKIMMFLIGALILPMTTKANSITIVDKDGVEHYLYNGSTPVETCNAEEICFNVEQKKIIVKAFTGRQIKIDNVDTNNDSQLDEIIIEVLGESGVTMLTTTGDKNFIETNNPTNIKGPGRIELYMNGTGKAIEALNDLTFDNGEIFVKKSGSNCEGLNTEIMTLENAKLKMVNGSSIWIIGSVQNEIYSGCLNPETETGYGDDYLISDKYTMKIVNSTIEINDSKISVEGYPYGLYYEGGNNGNTINIISSSFGASAYYNGYATNIINAQINIDAASSFTFSRIQPKARDGKNYYYHQNEVAKFSNSTINNSGNFLVRGGSKTATLLLDSTTINQNDVNFSVSNSNLEKFSSLSLEELDKIYPAIILSNGSKINIKSDIVKSPENPVIEAYNGSATNKVYTDSFVQLYYVSDLFDLIDGVQLKTPFPILKGFTNYFSIAYKDTLKIFNVIPALEKLLPSDQKINCIGEYSYSPKSFTEGPHQYRFPTSLFLDNYESMLFGTYTFADSDINFIEYGMEKEGDYYVVNLDKTTATEAHRFFIVGTNQKVEANRKYEMQDGTLKDVGSSTESDNSSGNVENGTNSADSEIENPKTGGIIATTIVLILISGYLYIKNSIKKKNKFYKI